MHGDFAADGDSGESENKVMSNRHIWPRHHGTWSRRTLCTAYPELECVRGRGRCVGSVSLVFRPVGRGLARPEVARDPSTHQAIRHCMGVGPTGRSNNQSIYYETLLSYWVKTHGCSNCGYVNKWVSA